MVSNSNLTNTALDERVIFLERWKDAVLERPPENHKQLLEQISSELEEIENVLAQRQHNNLQQLTPGLYQYQNNNNNENHNNGNNAKTTGQSSTSSQHQTE